MPTVFARMLKRLRERRKLTQLELARRARVPQGYISALESGEKTNPGLDVLRRLARALGVPVAELLE
jgi:transcriptional regulator with XRE-family HTH domain